MTIKNLILLFISLFIFSCDDDPVSPPVIHGCMDSQSCNYNPDSTHDNNSCLYLDECGQCGGENESMDVCGVCDGSGLNDNNCCDGEVQLWGECYNIETTHTLHFSYDQLTGEIPSEIGDLINVITINLDNNQLTGEIPSSIGNLTNLEWLFLNDNQLTGEIPSELGNLINLNYFRLDDNQLSGVIPIEICNQGVSNPGVYNNRLCPPYPSCITQINIDSQDTSNCP